MSNDKERYFIPSEDIQLDMPPDVKIPALRALHEVVSDLLELDSKMSLQAVQVLLVVAMRPESSQGHIGQKTGIQQSTLSRVLSHLGKGKPGNRGLGLVLSKVDQQNERRKLFYLSKQGDQVMQQLTLKLMR